MNHTNVGVCVLVNAVVLRAKGTCGLQVSHSQTFYHLHEVLSTFNKLILHSLQVALFAPNVSFCTVSLYHCTTCATLLCNIECMSRLRIGGWVGCTISLLSLCALDTLTSSPLPRLTRVIHDYMYIHNRLTLHCLQVALFSLNVFLYDCTACRFMSNSNYLSSTVFM